MDVVPAGIPVNVVSVGHPAETVDLGVFPSAPLSDAQQRIVLKELGGTPEYFSSWGGGLNM